MQAWPAVLLSEAAFQKIQSSWQTACAHQPDENDGMQVQDVLENAWQSFFENLGSRSS